MAHLEDTRFDLSELKHLVEGMLLRERDKFIADLIEFDQLSEGVASAYLTVERAKGEQCN